jgi:hypothetical protein
MIPQMTQMLVFLLFSCVISQELSDKELNDPVNKIWRAIDNYDLFELKKVNFIKLFLLTPVGLRKQ